MKPKQSTLHTLGELVAFDTTSRNSNLQLIEFIAARLESSGIPFELTYDREKRKANLFATLGESKSPGVVLSGHTDVVPVDGQEWSSDPFATEIRGDLMFGRGVCDMKGFIAVCLEKVSDILDADLDIPVHFAFSYDEEVGCLGVVGLLDALKKRPVLPRYCIIGEPTSMGIIRAHKGMLFKRCCVRGKSVHSSLVHQGVNAVSVAAKLIHKADDIQQRIQQEGPFDESFEPPYTTLHCGVIKGGTVNNIIPHHCQFDFEIRNLPGHSPLALFSEIETYGTESLQPAMHAVDTGSGIDWQTLADFPGMDTPADDAVVALAAKVLGCEIRTGKVSYGTEGGHFQNAGIATVICGPGSIEQAHKPDEYIELSQIARGEQFISSLLTTLKSQ